MKIRVGHAVISTAVFKKRTNMALHAIRTLLAMLGVDRKYRKIFAIGFNKTATTSIHEVFKSAGYQSLHSVSWRPAKLSMVFFTYNAFSDGPPDDFSVFDGRIPGAKFILNVRDADEWIDSRLEHIRFIEGNKRGRIQRPASFWSLDDVSVKHWVKIRNEYHLSVLEYFKDRPDDLLVVNFIRDPHAATKISTFIGGEQLSEKPHSRPIPKTREAGELRNAERIIRCFTELSISEKHWKNDISFPSIFPKGEGLGWANDTGSGLAYSELRRDVS